MIRKLFLGIVTAAAVALSAPAAAQQASPYGMDTVPAAEQVREAASPAPVTQATAQRPVPPRTLRAYWHLFIAFAFAWALLFGYLLYLGARTRRIERDLEQLRSMSPPEL
jgi:CcmD family protein